MITIEAGQEMKLSVQTVDPSVVTNSKTIRYVNPMATKSTEANITFLVRSLYKNSKNTYKGTKASIDLGYLAEE